MKSYIVCSTQRSGSTMFCNYLEALQIFGVPRERFLFLEKNEKILSGRQLELKSMPLTESAKHAFLDSASNSTRMHGVKMMASTLRCFPRAEISSKKNIGEEDFFREVSDFLEKNSGVEKYIYWRRQNKVEQALSHYYLRKTGIAHVYNERDEASYNAAASSFSVDLKEVERELYRILVDEQLWSRFFIINGIDPLVVNYEDFLANKAERLSEIVQYLGFRLDAIDVDKISKSVGLKKISKNNDRSALVDIEMRFREKYYKSFDFFF